MEAETMKLMIASDIHGSYAYCARMLDAFRIEAPDRLLLLGDILYHGPRNGLPAEYEPKKVIDALNQVKDKVLCVRGNCDAEIDQMVLEFPILADYCILYLGGRTIFATHGHHYNKKALPPLMPGDILLHGHTHVPAWERVSLGEESPEEQIMKEDKATDPFVYYFNPGSVSFPKENSPHGYMVMEEKLPSDPEKLPEEKPAPALLRVQWKDLDGTVYHEEML